MTYPLCNSLGLLHSDSDGHGDRYSANDVEKALQEKAALLSILVDECDSEFGWPPWEKLKAELRLLGVQVQLADDD